MPPRQLSIRSALFAVALCGVATLVGCRREAPEMAGSASEPAAAVRQLAVLLHDNDLAGFARAAVPPADHAALEQAWREGRSRWPLTELPLDEQVEPLLAALSAPGAEQTLQQGFRRNFANQDKDLKDAARSLGAFGVQYVKREGVMTTDERAHYAQTIAALSEWAQRAPLADPKRGAAAIPPLVAAARATGLADEAAFRQAGMEQSLRRLSPFFAQVKTLLAGYGLSLDEAFSELRTGLVEQSGDRARVRIHYPLAGREIDTVVSLERRDGHWYLADYLRHAREAVAVPPTEDAGAIEPTAPTAVEPAPEKTPPRAD